MVLWPGQLRIEPRDVPSLRTLVGLKERHPGALVIAHPECEEPLLAMADFIGSTTALLKYAVASPARELIVVTEAGILHAMQKAAPEKSFIPAPPDASCACNECPFMRMNTLEKVYLSLRDLAPRIEMSRDLLDRARLPIDRMLALS